MKKKKKCRGKAAGKTGARRTSSERRMMMKVVAEVKSSLVADHSRHFDTFASLWETSAAHLEEVASALLRDPAAKVGADSVAQMLDFVSETWIYLCHPLAGKLSKDESDFFLSLVEHETLAWQKLFRAAASARPAVREAADRGERLAVALVCAMRDLFLGFIEGNVLPRDCFETRDALARDLGSVLGRADA